jgi:5'-nucleotidase
MRILLTNDDGINAAGFGVLQQIAAEVGDEIWSVAPETDQSGTAHSLSLHDPLRCKPMGERSFSVRGTPTDCVIMAVQHLMPHKPDLILSGVNHGENAAADVTYSGTVAGAIEGTLLGIPSVALSLSFGDNTPVSAQWDTPLQHAPALIRKLIKAGWPANVLININFPNCPPAATKSAMVVRQSTKEEAIWTVADRMDNRGKPYFWLGYVPRSQMPPEGTDIWAIHNGHIAVTPLHLDMTHDATAAALSKVFGKA